MLILASEIQERQDGSEPMTTIALVDDDRNILSSLSMALEQEGYHVKTYTDGATALSALQATPPALAILDIKTRSTRRWA